MAFFAYFHLRAASTGGNGPISTVSAGLPEASRTATPSPQGPTAPPAGTRKKSPSPNSIPVSAESAGRPCADAETVPAIDIEFATPPDARNNPPPEILTFVLAEREAAERESAVTDSTVNAPPARMRLAERACPAASTSPPAEISFTVAAPDMAMFEPAERFSALPEPGCVAPPPTVKDVPAATSP